MTELDEGEGAVIRHPSEHGGKGAVANQIAHHDLALNLYVWWW